jgi:hypothetical protein
MHIHGSKERKKPTTKNAPKYHLEASTIASNPAAWKMPSPHPKIMISILKILMIVASTGHLLPLKSYVSTYIIQVFS